MMDIRQAREALLALPGIDGVEIALGIELHCVNPTTDLPDETWYGLGKIQTNLAMQGGVERPLTLIGELPISWGVR
jgi:hypothetical protein